MGTQGSTVQVLFLFFLSSFLAALAQPDLGAAAGLGRLGRVPKRVHWAIG